MYSFSAPLFQYKSLMVEANRITVPSGIQILLLPLQSTARGNDTWHAPAQPSRHMSADPALRMGKLQIVL